ncbi:MAG TPA: hypothetical protein VM715_12825, partial [Candidatus Acidoferrum sp.]|nr:hypothetical protein [Candidatus Acidoferrum sp.]
CSRVWNIDMLLQEVREQRQPTDHMDSLMSLGWGRHVLRLRDQDASDPGVPFSAFYAQKHDDSDTG